MHERSAGFADTSREGRFAGSQEQLVSPETGLSYVATLRWAAGRAYRRPISPPQQFRLSLIMPVAHGGCAGEKHLATRSFAPVLSGIVLAAVTATCRASSSDATAEPIIVTASRISQTENQALASVTVITRKQIEQTQASNMVELLRTVAGIDVARAGGPGAQTSVFMRGTNSNHVLVLIDGVRAADATGGSFAWENLDPSQIERIEIVRGPRATLYGSDAIGGVIQIFTRKPRGPVARLELGSFGTHGAAIGGGTTAGKIRFFADASYRGATGFPATNPSAGPYLYSPQNDGYQQHSVTAGMDAPLGTSASLGLTAWNAIQSTQFDPAGDFSRAENRVVSLNLRDTTTTAWTQSVRIGNAFVNLDSYGSDLSQISTHRNSFDWKNNIGLGQDSVLTAGYSYVNDIGFSNDITNAVLYNDSVHDNAVFADLLNSFGDQQLQFGLRRDEQSTFGGHTTGQVAWGWNPDLAWRWFASYGTAFRAPDFNELFSPGYSGFFAGNPNLQPETSRSTEIGTRYRLTPAQSLRASIYYTRVSNLIDFSGTNDQAINIDRASMRGLELRYAWHRGPWSYDANATLQKAVDDLTGAYLLRRPNRKLYMRLQRAFARHEDLGTEVFAASDHYDVSNITYTTVDIPGYAVMDLYGTYPLSRSWTAEARLNNVLDQHYQIVSGYNTPTRSVFFVLRYAPGRSRS